MSKHPEPSDVVKSIQKYSEEYPDVEVKSTKLIGSLENVLEMANVVMDDVENGTAMDISRKNDEFYVRLYEFPTRNRIPLKRLTKGVMEAWKDARPIVDEVIVNDSSIIVKSPREESILEPPIPTQRIKSTLEGDTLVQEFGLQNTHRIRNNPRQALGYSRYNLLAISGQVYCPNCGDGLLSAQSNHWRCICPFVIKIDPEQSWLEDPEAIQEEFPERS